ncbi:hypothetical protein LTR53_005167 [Teratosphaeriaceae sp. CCFEE 6253]|nr:hypothetical protein LTR53_005167 [Teratosphaeriaceae sp. CCFEE 6253]
MAGSSCPLESLPVEIIEFILPDLSLDDIRHLRLTSQTVCRNASAGHFKTFCRRKTVDLRVPALRRMSERITRGSVASDLRHLTLTGMLYVPLSLEKVLRTKTVPADPTDTFGRRKDALGNNIATRPCRLPATDEQIAETERDLARLRAGQHEAAGDRASAEDLAALTELFTRIRAHGVARGLDSLTLSVAVARSSRTRLAPEDGGAFQPIADTAQHTLDLALRAVAASGLPLRGLDVYETVRACSVSSHDLSRILPGITDRGTALHGLRCLALSTSPHALLSTACPDRADPDALQREGAALQRGQRIHRHRVEASAARAALAAQHAEPDGAGLAALLRRLPQLEELDWHRYHFATDHPLDNDDADHDESAGGRGLFAHAVRHSQSRALRRLTLRGWMVDAADILGLLRQNPRLEDVTLRHVTLRKGTWYAIFRHLPDALPAYTRIYLDVLHEQAHPNVPWAFMQLPLADAHLEARGCPASGGLGALLLEGSALVPGGIGYEVSRQQCDCAQAARWWCEARGEYGPPEHG